MAVDTPEYTHTDPDSESGIAEAVADDAESTLTRLRAQADDVVERMRPGLDAVTGYVRDEPTKSMIASAAVGAGIMALLVMLSRSGSRSTARPVQRSGAMSSIRDAALDLADRAHVAANDALASAQRTTRGLFSLAGAGADRAFAAAQQRSDSVHEATRSKADQAALAAQQRADDGFAAAKHKAGDASDAAATAMSDAWSSLREHADPVVERLRPQLEAAARYAREDPTRAALGVATAGALLIGLYALTRSSSDE